MFPCLTSREAARVFQSNLYTVSAMKNLLNYDHFSILLWLVPCQAPCTKIAALA